MDPNNPLPIILRTPRPPDIVTGRAGFFNIRGRDYHQDCEKANTAKTLAGTCTCVYIGISNTSSVLFLEPP